MFPKVFLFYHGIGRFIASKHSCVSTWFRLTDITLKIPCSSASHTASLEVIGTVGNTKLYCSSPDAIETVASPTLYCIFQGCSCLRTCRQSKGVVSRQRPRLPGKHCINFRKLLQIVFKDSRDVTGGWSELLISYV